VPSWLACDMVLGLQGGRWREDLRLAYREYVEAAVREGSVEDPWEQLFGQIVLGSQEFLRSLREHWQGNDREQPALRAIRARPTFAQVVAAVERLKGERWDQFRSRHGDWGRDLALYLGRKKGGLKLRELGDTCEGMDYAGVSVAVKRFERRVAADKDLARLLARAEAELLIVEM
jgi:hypothetical protein